MRASIRVQFLVGETVIYQKALRLPISFDNFKFLKEKVTE